MKGGEDMARKISSLTKKYVVVLLCVLMFLSFCLIPAGYVLSDFMGYEIVITNYYAAALIITVMPVILTVFYKVSECCEKRKSISVLLGLSLPLSLINGLILSIKSGGVFVIICSALSFGCLLFINARRINMILIKNAAIALSVTVVIAALVIVYFKSLLGGFVKNTVIQTVGSPDGTRYAELIDSDAGATGGATIVNVCSFSSVEFGIFKIKQKETVYSGRWSDQFDIRIYWKDNRHLMINSTEYTV